MRKIELSAGKGSYCLADEPLLCRMAIFLEDQARGHAELSEHLESLLEIFSLQSIIVLLLLLVKSLPPLELHL